jgi:hypothetical protein
MNERGPDCVESQDQEVFAILRLGLLSGVRRSPSEPGETRSLLSKIAN